MSGPTRGMVAGQAITTQAQTKEFDEGFDRTFGERKSERGRWVYGEGGPMKVGEEWTDTERRAQVATEEIIYGGVQATDGTDISTRRKHREYLKANGLSMASDFKEHWPKMQKERERILSGEADTKERKEILGRALYEARKGKR